MKIEYFSAVRVDDMNPIDTGNDGGIDASIDRPGVDDMFAGQFFDFIGFHRGLLKKIDGNRKRASKKT